MNITQNTQEKKINQDFFVSNALNVESIVKSDKNNNDKQLELKEYYRKNNIDITQQQFINSLVDVKTKLDETNYSGLDEAIKNKNNIDETKIELVVEHVKKGISSEMLYSILFDIAVNKKDLLKIEQIVEKTDIINEVSKFYFDLTEEDLSKKYTEPFSYDQLVSTINYDTSSIEYLKSLDLNELYEIWKRTKKIITAQVDKAIIDEYTESARLTKNYKEFFKNVFELSNKITDNTFTVSSDELQSLTTNELRKRKFDIGTITQNIFNGIAPVSFEGDLNFLSQVVLEKIADTELVRNITNGIFSLGAWNNLYTKFNISSEVRDLLHKYTFAPEVNYNFEIEILKPKTFGENNKKENKIRNQYSTNPKGFNFKSDLRYDLFTDEFSRFMNLSLISVELPEVKYTTKELTGMYGIKEMTSVMSGFDYENITLKFLSNNTWDLYKYFLAFNNIAFNLQNKTIGYPAEYKFDMKIRVYIDSYYENPNNVTKEGSYILYTLKDCFIRSIDKEDKNASKQGDVALKTFSIGINYKTFELKQINGSTNNLAGSVLQGVESFIQGLNITNPLEQQSSTPSIVLYKTPANIINPARI